MTAPMGPRPDPDDPVSTGPGSPIVEDRARGPLRVETSWRGGTHVIALIGEASVWDADVFGSVVGEVAATPPPGPRDIVIDLSACTLLSSLGVARIIDLSRIARGYGGNVRLAAPRPTVLQVIRTLHLEQLCTVYETLEAALRAAFPAEAASDQRGAA